MVSLYLDEAVVGNAIILQSGTNSVIIKNKTSYKSTLWTRFITNQCTSGNSFTTVLLNKVSPFYVPCLTLYYRQEPQGSCKRSRSGLWWDIDSYLSRVYCLSCLTFWFSPANANQRPQQPPPKSVSTQYLQLSFHLIRCYNLDGGGGGGGDKNNELTKKTWRG
jgi:hypothetical protein